MSTFDWARSFQDQIDSSVERTPDMHGGAKEEQLQDDTPPGWYANCYCCGKSYEEQHMVRKEYRREATEGKGWSARVIVSRYVISFCVWCNHSLIGSQSKR